MSRSLVLLVLPSAREAQVRNSVVIANAVDVVKLVARERARLVQPRQPMRVILFAIDAKPSIPVRFINAAPRLFAHRCTFAGASQAREDARFWVIKNKRHQSLLVNHANPFNVRESQPNKNLICVRSRVTMSLYRAILDSA